MLILGKLILKGENISVKNIRNLRMRKSMSQSELAAAVGVSQGTVSLWENRDQMPNVETLRKLARILDCSFDELLGIQKAV